mgnify:CR=1 FL=1
MHVIVNYAQNKTSASSFESINRPLSNSPRFGLYMRQRCGVPRPIRKLAQAFVTDKPTKDEDTQTSAKQWLTDVYVVRRRRSTPRFVRS